MKKEEEEKAIVFFIQEKEGARGMRFCKKGASFSPIKKGVDLKPKKRKRIRGLEDFLFITLAQDPGLLKGWLIQFTR